MMLCNRYKLTNRIARYIFQISLKYTNINLFRNDLDKTKTIALANFTWHERQKVSSLLAHEALHNVFAFVDPKYLTLKE